MPRIVPSRLPDGTRELMTDLACLERDQLAEVEGLLAKGHRGALEFQDVDRLQAIIPFSDFDRLTIAYEAVTGRRVRAAGQRSAGQGLGRERSRRVARDTRGLK